MTDAKKNAEQLAETWLEAMSILSKKQIESVSFDKTVEATVTDATRASEGIYVVSTGNASFTAYTTEVGYKNNDAVMVTIPQGNYDKQKIIIGKQVNKQDGPIIYKSPFEKIIDITNNIIQGEYQVGYWANGEKYKWEGQSGYCIRPSAMEEILNEGTRYCYRENQNSDWKLLQTYTAIQPWTELAKYDFSGFGFLDSNNKKISNEFILGNDIDKWFKNDGSGYKITAVALKEILELGKCYYKKSSNETQWQIVTEETVVTVEDSLGQVNLDGFQSIKSNFILTSSEPLNDISIWFDKNTEGTEENGYKIKSEKLIEIQQQDKYYVYKSLLSDGVWSIINENTIVQPGYWIGQFFSSDLIDDESEITIDDESEITNIFQLTEKNSYITNWFFYNNGLPETTIEPFYSNEKCFYQNFSLLGLRAQFSTWLGEYDTIQGNYGLAIVLTFSYSVGDVNQEFSKVIQFDSNEFLGDPYNFETFYTQEQVFDISDYQDYPIVGIKLYAYQKNNFKSIDGDRIPAPDEDDFSIINPNIFVKSPYICLGNSVDDFQTDTAEIMCDTALTYYKTATGQQQNRDEDNKKTIQLRWIHKDTNTDIIKAVEDGVLPENYEIRWYRYQAGAPSPDQFAGAHWQRFYGIKDKAEPATGEWVLSQKDVDTATNSTEIIFRPNVNRQEEKIKAIIIKNEAEVISRLITSSNVLIFTNDNEVRNKVTLIDANALSIKFEDDEKGHYFLYDESGEIGKNEDTEVRILTAVFDERPDGERELDVQKKAKLNVDDCSKVVWTFPNASMNTMIVPMSEANENASVLAPDQEGNYIISSKVQSVGFTIKKWLNNNATQNRIRLDITKDGQDYSAWVDPIFGTAGDNGSDYKVVLTWKNSKNALNLSKEYKLITSQEEFNELNQVYNESGIKQEKNGWAENQYYKGIFLESYDGNQDQTALIGDVVIFDQAGDVVDWPENAELEVNWLVAEFGETSVKQKEKEEEDIYYPVFKNNINALNQQYYQLITEEIEFNRLNIVYNANGEPIDKGNWDLNEQYYKNLNPEGLYQSANYYYFVDNNYDSNILNWFTYDTNKKGYSNFNNPDNSTYVFKPFDENSKWKDLDYDSVVQHGYWIGKRVNNDIENAFQLIEYVKFDPINRIFTNDNLNFNEDQLYRKRINNDEKKNKLEFRKVNFTTPPFNEETGEYQQGHGNNIEPIQIIEGEKQYYYSTNKKYFIKVNDQYILDPWLDYQKVETYYEPIEAKEKVYTLDSVGNTVGGLTAAADHQTVTITANTNVSMDSLFILQLTLKNFGDYDLISYYPIALKDGETRENIGSLEEPQYQMKKVIQYIEGPDRVRYGSSGETDFKKNPYQISTLQFENGKFVQYRHGFDDPLSTDFKDFNYILITTEDEFNNINEVYNQDGIPKEKTDWAEDTYYEKIGKSHFDPPYNFNGYWKLLFPKNSEASNFDPVLQESYKVDPNDATYVEFDKPLLSPSGVYIPEVRPYGVQFVDSNNVCLWTQPILVYQNKYPSRTLNKWNGKDIETDDGAGTITASGFAAGRKERDDNTFTGVVIGDWSRSKADTVITKNTGVYGFNHGAMSYAFKDDGTGFIGKDGSGRIYFDGNKSLIYSSKWKSFSGVQGMLLDIDDGVIDIRGPFVSEHQVQTQAQVYISPNPGRYLNIKDESGRDLLKISRNKYYLQTSDFEDTAQSKKGVKLDLSSGQFIGYNFLIHAASEDGYIDINSSGNTNYPLQIGTGDSPYFKVSWGGALEARSGEIGSWKIEPITSPTPSVDKQIIFDPNDNSISLRDYNDSNNSDENENEIQVLETFPYAGTLHNSFDSPTVVLSSKGIIYGADLYGGKITGGEIYGGSLNPLLYTTGTGEDTNKNQVIKLNGYLQVEPLNAFIMPSDPAQTTQNVSYFGYAASNDTSADSLNDNNYSIDTTNGIAMRTIVVTEDDQTVERVQEVKSTGKNAGVSSTTTVDNGVMQGKITSYVSVYSTTPSAKMDTVFKASSGPSFSSFVRTHIDGVTLLNKIGNTIRGQININRTGDDVIVIQVGSSNIKIGTSNGTTETITINTGGTVNITGRTINLNKPAQVAVDEIPSLSTNFLPGEQTGIYARFAPDPPPVTNEEEGTEEP